MRDDISSSSAICFYIYHRKIILTEVFDHRAHEWVSIKTGEKFDHSPDHKLVFMRLVSTARNEKSREKAKSERMLFPRYLTMRPSHKLILCQMLFLLFLSFTVFCSFIHSFLDCIRTRQFQKIIKPLPFKKRSTISFPLRFSSKIPLFCHREVMMWNKIQRMFSL